MDQQFQIRNNFNPIQEVLDILNILHQVIKKTNLYKPSCKNISCAIPGAIIGLISLLLIVFTCWDTVEVTYYGIKCNTFSKKCSTQEIYESGRYFIGPFNYFVEFPGTLQTISFANNNSNRALSTRTSEGLNLLLEISIQYQLKKGQLEPLYQTYNMRYEQTYIKIARDVILQAAGSYQAVSYWTERQMIVDDIKKQLNQEMQKAYTDVKYFAILSIELPDLYEDSIVQTQVETQQKKTKEFEKLSVKIKQEIEVMISENKSKIKYIESQAQADAFNIRQSAQAEYIRDTLGAEEKAYKKLKDDCRFNNEELNNFIYFSSLLGKVKQSQLYAGVNDIIADARSKN
ncbi:hypothetical protein ABPG72_002035 [Tetrahymena utriculariae]